tara:strand:- start:13339 stop:13566 length:228 start_codon:yes stop_codon:yes gene_type:complete
MKKYVLIWDKKLQQMFKLFVNNGFWGGKAITPQDIKDRLLERSNINLDDIDRYITFDSDSDSVLPFYKQSVLEDK